MTGREIEWEEERLGPWIVAVFIAAVLIIAGVAIWASPAHRRAPDDPQRIEVTCFSDEGTVPCP